MTYAIPRSLTVLIDSNERQPYRFPPTWVWHGNGKPHVFEIKTDATTRLSHYNKIVAYNYGDYVLQGFRDVASVEKKYGVAEIANNVSAADWPRFERALRVWRACVKHRYLVLDATLGEAKRPLPHSQVPPEAIMDKFWKFAAEYDLHVVWLSSGCSVQTALTLGEQVLSILWTRAYAHLTSQEKLP